MQWIPARAKVTFEFPQFLSPWSQSTFRTSSQWTYLKLRKYKICLSICNFWHTSDLLLNSLEKAELSVGTGEAISLFTYTGSSEPVFSNKINMMKFHIIFYRRVYSPILGLLGKLASLLPTLDVDGWTPLRFSCS